MNHFLTVEQLIKKLETYPKDSLVMVDGYEDDFDAVLNLESINVKYNNENPWWNGRFIEDIESGINAIKIKSTRGQKL